MVHSIALEGNLKILSLNISKLKGTVKTPVNEITINEKGIVGDAHAQNGHRQISLLAQESIDQFSKQANERNFLPGEFAENITTQGLDFTQISILDRLVIGPVELEVSQIGKKCHGDSCSIFQEVGKCVMPKEGIFCRVISGGSIKIEDTIQLKQRPLSFNIITLSDRASRGEYDDLSGPQIQMKTEEYFKDKRWHLQIERSIIPDNKEKLTEELNQCLEKNADIIITTGGTGLGPSDITPEVATEFCDKLIPGVMEYIRFKYGSQKPNALLSRSVAGIKNKTLLYTLPGSVKAVNEYMSEILLTTEHSLLMLNGLGH